MNYVVKRFNYDRFSASVMLFIALLASLFQFHSHDCHGHPWMYTPIACISIGCEDVFNTVTAGVEYDAHSDHDNPDCPFHFTPAVSDAGKLCTLRLRASDDSFDYMAGIVGNGESGERKICTRIIGYDGIISVCRDGVRTCPLRGSPPNNVL